MGQEGSGAVLSEKLVDIAAQGFEAFHVFGTEGVEQEIFGLYQYRLGHVALRIKW